MTNSILVNHGYKIIKQYMQKEYVHMKLTKVQKDKIITQCKQELKDRYINADVFDYIVTTDEIIYGTEIMTLNVLVQKDGNNYYEFNEIYIDDDFNCLQWHLHIQ